MYGSKTITIRHQWKKVEIEIDKIIYVLMHRQDAEIHVYGDKTYKARITCEELKKKLGECFIEIRCGCIVSAMAIRSITDTVNLMNGESLRYTLNKKTKLRNEIYRKQQEILESFADDAPRTQKEYRQHYICYENALSHLLILKWCLTRKVTLWTGYSATEMKPLQRLRTVRLKSLLAEFSAVFLRIWTVSGSEAMSEPFFTVKRWRLSTTARKLTSIYG